MINKIMSVLISLSVLIASVFGINISCMINDIYNDSSYGENERNTLDLYIPKYCSDEVGLVLYIHGGSWTTRDKSDYSGDIRKTADRLRVAAASMNYRYLSDDVDMYDLLDDIESALLYIKNVGEEKGIKIEKVLLTGYSAGAHLAMLYAYSRADTAPITPVAVVAKSGPTDFTDENYYSNNGLGDSPLFSYAIGEHFDNADRDRVRDKLEKASPIYYVNKNTVPTVINHGAKDELVPFSNAESLDKKLTEYGVKHSFNVYPNSNHGLSDDKKNSKIADSLFTEYCLMYLK